MKLENLLEGVKIKELNAHPELEVRGLCYHSERCHKGYGFFVRKGLKFDGTAFVGQCVDKGVSVFFSEERIENFPCVVVEDIRKAQAIISANFYGNPQREIKVIGITGTNGKTTTSYLLHRGLNAGLISTVEVKTGKRVVKSTLTTPESTDIFEYLREMADNGLKYAVIEVSAHAFILDRVYGIEFDGIVFTGFSQDHLDYFKTMENYLNAKLLIFDRLKKDGFCVVNSDLDILDTILKKCSGKLILAGKSEKADVRIMDVRFINKGLKVKINLFGKDRIVHLPIIGDYNAYNLAFACGVIHQSGLSVDSFLKEVEKGFSVPGRVETIESPDGFLIVVDFAHTPEGLENLLSSISKHTQGKVITVFGCGGERDRKKRPLMLEAVCRYSDRVFITADNPRGEPLSQIFEDIKKGNTYGKGVFFIEDRREAIFKAIRSAKEGDVVVIAGKGHEDYQIIGDRKIPFSDREVALEALKV